MSVSTEVDRLHPFPDLRNVFGIAWSREQVRRKVKTGEFCAPVRVSANRVAWREGDVRAWIRKRPAAA